MSRFLDKFRSNEMLCAGPAQSGSARGCHGNHGSIFSSKICVGQLKVFGCYNVFLLKFGCLCSMATKLGDSPGKLKQ
uniref:Uncharacterized protein n=1 Tax=Romanomermis culicivorax TaxID=13658 RepID=A0A915KDY1_ROMCU